MASKSSVPQYLQHLTVLEMAGLAPGPLCGQMFADYGARVIRIDRAKSPAAARAENPDTLTRGKQSLALNLKLAEGKAVLAALLAHPDVNVLVDTYRPGVLERIVDLDAVAAARAQAKTATPLVVVRLTGYGQDSPLAGHDLNYIAKAGLLSALGTEGTPPMPPINVLGDFASLALPAFAAVLVALYGHASDKSASTNDSSSNNDNANAQSEQKVVQIDVNIVESLRYLAQFVSFARYNTETAMYRSDAPRGQNILDGQACPFYTVYETANAGEYLSVGALEPQFYTSFLDFLGFKAGGHNTTNANPKDTKPIEGIDEVLPNRFDRANWPLLRTLFQHRLKQQPLAHWAARASRFPDACVMPVEPLAPPHLIPDAIVTGFGSSTSHGKQPQSSVGLDASKTSPPSPGIGGSKRGDTVTGKGQILAPGTHSYVVLSELLGPCWQENYGPGDYVYQHKESNL